MCWEPFRVFGVNENLTPHFRALCAMSLRTLNDEPRCARSRMLMPLPKRVVPKIDKELPRRAKLRRLRELPRCTMSSTLSVEPKRPGAPQDTRVGSRL